MTGSFLTTHQIGVETVPGTSVAANRWLHALVFLLKLNQGVQQARQRGNKYENAQQSHRIYGEGNYEGLLCYNSIIYILSSLFANPAAVAVSSLTAGSAYTRTYLARNLVDTTRKTYTFEAGTSDAVDKYPYGQLSSMQLNMSQEEAHLSGNLFARQPTFNQSQTSSPTQIAARPVTRRQINFYLDTAYGSLGSTKMTQVFRESLSIGEKWAPAWSHNSGQSNTFHRANEKKGPPLSFNFLMAHNAQSRGITTNILDRNIRYARLACIGAQIATQTGGIPVYESIIFDAAGKVEAAEPDEDQDVQGRRYSFRSLYDINLGFAMRIVVTNSLASL